MSDYSISAEIVPSLAAGFSIQAKALLSRATARLDASVKVSPDLTGFAKQVERSIAAMGPLRVEVEVAAGGSGLRRQLDKLYGEYGRRVIAWDLGIDTAPARGRLADLHSRWHGRQVDWDLDVDVAGADANLRALSASWDAHVLSWSVQVSMPGGGLPELPDMPHFRMPNFNVPGIGASGDTLSSLAGAAADAAESMGNLSAAMTTAAEAATAVGASTATAAASVAEAGTASMAAGFQATTVVTLFSSETAAIGVLDGALASLTAAWGVVTAVVAAFAAVIGVALAITAAMVAAALIAATAITAIAAAASLAAVAIASLAGVMGAALGGVIVLVAALKPVVGILSDYSSGSDKAADAADALARAQTAQSRTATQGAEQIAQAGRAVSAAKAGEIEAHKAAGRAAQEGAAAIAAAAMRVIAAQGREKQAQVDLTRARADALDQLEDLAAQAAGLADTEEGSRIRLARAQESAARIGKDAKATDLDKREAVLAVSEAQHGLEQTLLHGVRTQEEYAAAQKAGVAGSGLVVSAQKAVVDAHTATIDAAKALAKTQEDAALANVNAAAQVAAAAQATGDAQRAVAGAARDAAQANSDAAKAVSDAGKKYTEALKPMSLLSDAGRTFIGVMKPIIDFLAGPFSAAMQSAVLPGITALVTAFAGLITTTDAAGHTIVGGPLGNALISMGQAISGVAQGLAAAFTDPAVARGLGDLIAGGAEFVRILGPGIGDLLRSLIPALGTLATSSKPLFEGISALVSGVGTGLADMFAVFTQPAVQEALKSIATTLGNLIKEALPGIATLLAALAVSFAPMFEKLAPAIIMVGDAFGRILIQMANSGLIESFVVIFEQLAVVLLKMTEGGENSIIMKLSTAFLILLDVVVEMVADGTLMKLIDIFIMSLPVLVDITVLTLKVLGVLTQFEAWLMTSGADMANWFMMLWTDYAKPALTWIGDKFTWLWDVVIKPTLTWIGDKLNWLWTSVFSPVLGPGGFIDEAIKTFSVVVDWLWSGVFLPILGFIGDKITWLAVVIFKPMFDLISGIITDFWNDVVSPVFTWIGDKIAALWTNYISPLVDKFKGPLKEAVDWVGGIFNGLGDAWSGALDGALQKVRDFVNWVGRGVNIVVVGLQVIIPDLKKIAEPLWQEASKIGGAADSGSGSAGKVQLRAQGGYVSGPGGPTSDSIPARLSDGEFIMRAAAVEKIGVGNLNKMNAMGWATGGYVARYPRGGPVGDPPGPAGVSVAPSSLLKFARIGHVELNEAERGRIAQVQAGLRAQAGKPYSWAAAGPGGYDCSGIVSYAYNLIKGRNPYSHTFSTESLPGGFLSPGAGEFSVGYAHPGEKGASAGIGHTAGALAGLSFESTGSKGVRVGDSGASGAGSFLGGLAEGALAFFKRALKGTISTALGPIEDGIRGLGGPLMDKLAAAPRALLDRIPDSLFADRSAPSDASGPGAASGSDSVAQTAYDTAIRLGAGPKVLLALMEAGLVESGMKNLNYGDRDSVGFLQQRPSMGWPAPMNVGTATGSFVRRALDKQGRFANAGALAQAVQVSAFPSRYNARRGDALAWLAKVAPGFNAGAYSGFDRGGWLKPGAGALNLGRAPEAVLTPQESAGLKAGLRSGPVELGPRTLRKLEQALTLRATLDGAVVAASVDRRTSFALDTAGL